MRAKSFFTALVFVFICSGYLFAQCSDAGICIMGARNPEVLSKDLPDKISLGYSLGFSGKSGGDFTYNKLTMHADFKIYKFSRIEFSLPFSVNTGPLATEKGFGDMMLLLTQYVPFPAIGTLGISLGAKFSSGSADIDGLPQAYQPALGTNDLLFGVGSNIGLVNFYLGYQKSFDRSNNQFSRLKRGDEMMLRFGYTIPVNKTTVQAEIIGIKQLQVSNIKVAGSDPEVFIDIGGSNEAQVNLIARVTHMFKDYLRFETYAALPLLKKDYNLDGLTRTFSISVSMAYLFYLK
jgi:hypothetical protein